jgi:hypothetical protein
MRITCTVGETELENENGHPVPGTPMRHAHDAITKPNLSAPDRTASADAWS